MREATLTLIVTIILVTLEITRKPNTFKRIWQQHTKKRYTTKRQINKNLTYKIAKYLVDENFANNHKTIIIIFIGTTVALW